MGAAGSMDTQAGMTMRSERSLGIPRPDINFFLDEFKNVFLKQHTVMKPHPTPTAGQFRL